MFIVVNIRKVKLIQLRFLDHALSICNVCSLFWWEVVIYKQNNKDNRNNPGYWNESINLCSILAQCLTLLLGSPRVSTRVTRSKHLTAKGLPFGVIQPELELSNPGGHVKSPSLPSSIVGTLPVANITFRCNLENLKEVLNLNRL